MSALHRGSWFLVVALALPGLLHPAPLRAGPLEVLQTCARQASAGTTGLAHLGPVCPGLEDALQTLGLDRTLYEGWREKLNRDSLTDVARLIERYRGAAPAAAPNVSSLDGILKAIAREQAPAPKSWWEALKAWMNSWLNSHDADSLSWLDRLLEHIRQSVTLVNAIQYVLLGLVVLAAAWVVINELKTAGLTTRARKHPVSGSRARRLSADEALRVPDSIPMTGALSELLESLVMRLTQSGRLKAQRSLTHRELVVRSNFDNDSQRAVFADVAQAAESLLYGAHGVAGERISRVLREGRLLLAQLPGSSSNGEPV